MFKTLLFVVICAIAGCAGLADDEGCFGDDICVVLDDGPACATPPSEAGCLPPLEAGGCRSPCDCPACEICLRVCEARQ